MSPAEVIEVMDTGVVIDRNAATEFIEVVSQGPQGPTGPPGPIGLSGDGSAAISTDPDNRLTSGTDNGLFVPEITADPVAYYILSKA